MQAGYMSCRECPLSSHCGHQADRYRLRMSEAEASLHDAIERSYAAFAGMARPQKLHASPLRDAEGILRTLTSASLRDLKGEQVGPYSGWAITTVGDDRDYRHFLPRIFELAVTDPVWPGAEPPVMASRLNMARWRAWPAEQQAAVLHFFRAAFDAVVERHPHEGQSAEDWLCGIVTLGEPASPAFERWRSSPSPNAALQMASFIIEEAKHLSRHAEVRGPFWEDVRADVRREVAKLLTAGRTRDFLQAAAGQVRAEDQCHYLEAALAELRRQF